MKDNKKREPVLRFPEFEGEYENYSLGEIATFSKGKGISKSDVTEFGKIPCIRYGELYTIYSETISQAHSKTDLPSKDLILSEINDVIIPSSGETSLDIAKASCVLTAGIALGGDINIIKSKTNGVFLSYYLNSALKLKIASLSQGSSVIHLYATQLKKLNLNLPTHPEQTKIAEFLTAIDQKLLSIKKKKTLLEDYKKGVMQQLFSQQIRFKDDNGMEYPDWEWKKLEKVAVKKSSSITANSIETNSGSYPIYGASGYIKSVDFYEEQDDYISIVKDGAGVGRLLYCIGKSSVLGTLDILKNREGTNVKFLYYLLNQINFTKYITGSTIPHIYFKDYKSEILPIPKLMEQTKIANFLSAIDDKIKATQIQIEGMEQYKKGLLQKLFV